MVLAFSSCINGVKSTQVPEIHVLPEFLFPLAFAHRVYLSLPKLQVVLRKTLVQFHFESSQLPINAQELYSNEK